MMSCDGGVALMCRSYASAQAEGLEVISSASLEVKYSPEKVRSRRGRDSQKPLDLGQLPIVSTSASRNAAAAGYPIALGVEALLCVLVAIVRPLECSSLMPKGALKIIWPRSAG